MVANKTLRNTLQLHPTHKDDEIKFNCLTYIQEPSEKLKYLLEINNFKNAFRNNNSLGQQIKNYISKRGNTEI